MELLCRANLILLLISLFRLNPATLNPVAAAAVAASAVVASLLHSGLFKAGVLLLSVSHRHAERATDRPTNLIAMQIQQHFVPGIHADVVLLIDDDATVSWVGGWEANEHRHPRPMSVCLPCRRN